MNQNHLFPFLGALIISNYCQLPINAQANPNTANTANTQTSSQVNNPHVKYVDRDTAKQQATDIFVTAGKFTIIKFTENNTKNDSSIEKISNVSISDPSKNSHFISKENNSGIQGKVVFVRPTQTINFPLATTTEVPNLVVLTVDKAGNEEAFIFNIHTVNPEKFTEKIVITEPEPKIKPVVRPKNTIHTVYGEATPDDIKFGLTTLVNSNKLPENDPLIGQIDDYYALTTNGISSKVARNKLNLPLPVLVKLAEIGQVEDTKQRLTATPKP